MPIRVGKDAVFIMNNIPCFSGIQTRVQMPWTKGEKAMLMNAATDFELAGAARVVACQCLLYPSSITDPERSTFFVSITFRLLRARESMGLRVNPTAVGGTTQE